MRVKDVRRFAEENLPKLQNAVRMQRVVRRQFERAKLVSECPRTQCASLRADNHLLLPPLPQATSEHEQLMLPTPHVMTSIDVKYMHAR
jgi:hypothetical protein